MQKSTAGRNSAAIETIGTYNPLTKPAKVELKSDRALHWLMQGAVPTETVAVLFKKNGVLEEFFTQRPTARKKFGFLDKTTAAMSMESVIKAPTAVAEAPAEAKAEVKEEAPAEEVVAEAPAEESAEPVAEATEEPAVEAAEETKSE